MMIFVHNKLFLEINSWFSGFLFTWESRFLVTYLLIVPVNIGILTWFRIFLLNQNRNAACGQYKEEVLSQLRELARIEPNLDCKNTDAEFLMDFQSLVPDQNLKPGSMFTGYEYDGEPTMFSEYEVKLSVGIICKLFSYVILYFGSIVIFIRL